MSNFITHETYKGLTPEEQEKYGEEVSQVQPLIIYPDEEWRDLKPGETVENMNQLGRKTRIIHYLKPVEAQQSEGERIKQKADDIFGKEPCAPKVHYIVGFQDGSEWQSQQATSQLTALQQEVERLKEAQRWIPVTERLPMLGQRVLVYIGTKDRPTAISTFVGPNNIFLENHFDHTFRCLITHWQPLPPPPTN